MISVVRVWQHSLVIFIEFLWQHRFLVCIKCATRGVCSSSVIGWGWGMRVIMKCWYLKENKIIKNRNIHVLFFNLIILKVSGWKHEYTTHIPDVSNTCYCVYFVCLSLSDVAMYSSTNYIVKSYQILKYYYFWRIYISGAISAPCIKSCHCFHLMIF